MGVASGSKYVDGVFVVAVPVAARVEPVVEPREGVGSLLEPPARGRQGWVNSCKRNPARLFSFKSDPLNKFLTGY